MIEPEVAESLPSVKKLAQVYAKDNSPTLVQLSKPKVYELNCSVVVLVDSFPKLSKELSNNSNCAINERFSPKKLSCTSKFLSFFSSFASFFYRNQRIILRKVLV